MPAPRRLVLAAVLAIAATPAAALRDRPVGAGRPRLELVVIEVANCRICPLVRSHLLPRWEETTWARTVPMRFVDITRRDETTLGLTSPVEIAPTIVLLRDGREIERFPGYMGPEIFIEAMREVMRREQESE